MKRKRGRRRRNTRRMGRMDKRVFRGTEKEITRKGSWLIPPQGPGTVGE